MGLRAKARRLRLLMEKRFAGWNSVNLAALNVCQYLLTDENRMIATEFERIRRLSFP